MSDTAAEEARLQGNALYKSGHIADAIEQYLKAHELAPRQTSPLANLAAAYFELGEYSQSNDYADRALSLLHNDSAAEKSKSRLILRKVRALILLKQYEAAKRLVNSDVPQNLLADPEWTRLVKGLTTHHNEQGLLDEQSPFKPLTAESLDSEIIGEDKPTSLFDISLWSSDYNDKSFLFVNAGDARNVFATLQHIARPAINRPADATFDFTILNTNSHSTARILVLLQMLADLRDSAVSIKTSPLLATLFYAYMTPILPSKTAKMLKEYIDKVVHAIQSETLPGFVVLNPDQKQNVLHQLNFWSERAQDTVSIKDYCQDLDTEMDKITSLNDLEFFPTALKREARVFRKTGMLRSSLSDDDDTAIKKLFTADNMDFNSRSAITHQWEINRTLVSNQIAGQHQVSFDPFDFGSKISTSEISSTTTLSDLISTWLLDTAKALHTLGDRLRITLGGPSSMLPHPNLVSAPAISTRTSFDRIHLSSLPDVTGGTLYVYLYAVPLLHSNATSYVTWKCSRWAKIFTSWNKYDLEFLALVPTQQDDVRKLFGIRPGEDVHAQDSSSYLFDSTSISGYRRARHANDKLSYQDLVPRVQVTTWLYRILLKTVKPYVEEGTGVYSPFNLSVLVPIITRLHGLGYPAHWLSDVVAAIFTGTIKTSARAPASRPLKAKEVTSSVAEREQVIGFCSLELQRILGVTELGFGLVLPAGAGFKLYQIHLDIIPEAEAADGSLVLVLAAATNLDTAVGDLSLTKQQSSQLATAQLITCFNWMPASKMASFWWSESSMKASCATGAVLQLRVAESWTAVSRAMSVDAIAIVA